MFFYLMPYDKGFDIENVINVAVSIDLSEKILKTAERLDTSENDGITETTEAAFNEMQDLYREHIKSLGLHVEILEDGIYYLKRLDIKMADMVNYLSDVDITEEDVWDDKQHLCSIYTIPVLLQMIQDLQTRVYELESER